MITSNNGVATKHQVRATVRHHVSINAIIYSHGFPLAQCATRDIGLDGMFIKTEPLRVSKNTVLALEFDLPLGSAARHYRLPVFVGRRTTDQSEEGIQLIFLLHKEDLVRSYGNDLNSFIDRMNRQLTLDHVGLQERDVKSDLIMLRQTPSSDSERKLVKTSLMDDSNESF
jgi:hypothetical protein